MSDETDMQGGEGQVAEGGGEGLSGSTILTEALAGRELGQQTQRAPETADDAIRNVQDGPPEGVPAKFWDPEKREVRVQQLAESYTNLESLMGREQVPLPKGEDDTEALDRIYMAMGVPDSAEAYEFARPTDLPDDLPYNDDLEASFRATAVEARLTPKQAALIYDRYVKLSQEQHAQYNEMVKQNKANLTKDLQREYGREYQAAMTRVNEAMTAFADMDYVKMLEETGRGNDPREFRMWDRIAKQLKGEKRLVGKPTETSAVDYDKAIADFDKQHREALFDSGHPRHRALVAERNELFRKRYGDGK